MRRTSQGLPKPHLVRNAWTGKWYAMHCRDAAPGGSGRRICVTGPVLGSGYSVQQCMLKFLAEETRKSITVLESYARSARKCAQLDVRTGDHSRASGTHSSPRIRALWEHAYRQELAALTASTDNRTSAAADYSVGADRGHGRRARLELVATTVGAGVALQTVWGMRTTKEFR